MKTKQCSCGATMLMTRTINGKRQPFDAEPNPAGTFILVKRAPRLADAEEPLSIDLSRLGLYAADIEEAGAARYMPHHATCPDVENFRG